MLLALLLALSGCGGGGDEASPAGSAPTTAGPAGGSAATNTVGVTSPTGKAPAVAGKPEVPIPDGPPPDKLQITDLVAGTGAEAKAGQTVTVQYVGVAWSTKKEFDASWNTGRPFPFQLGTGNVIAGWDQGIPGMKVGGRRRLEIPPALAYQAAGYPPAIGPNETLVFVVDLLSVS
jgi:peptidylprolyl isomerase